MSSIMDVVASAGAYLNSSDSPLQSRCTDFTGTAAENQQEWEPPPSNWFKANVAAAVHQGSRQAGVGAFFRNSAGEIEAVTAQKILDSLAVEWLEVKAVEVAVKMAIEQGFLPLIVESDAPSVVKLISGDESLKDIQRIIEVIKEHINNVNRIVAQFRGRNSILLAHGIAKEAAYDTTTGTLEGILPL